MRPASIRPSFRPGRAASLVMLGLLASTSAAFAATDAAAPSSAAASSSFTLSGRITSADGQPVPGAHVRIVELGRHADAGADGVYRFEGVPRGAYLVEAQSDRFGTQLTRIDATQESVVVDIVLKVATHKEAIVVTSGLEATALGESARPVSVVADLDLAARLKPTLGETLAEEPGVSSTSFGPGASRPVIRGMGGDRVRVLQGGVGMADASNSSPDHAVSFDPLSAEQIEVMRGPATLLYGSTAIGGVVNVIDGRIPEAQADRAIGGVADLALGSGSSEKQGGASLHGGRGRVAFHIDALRRKTDDVNIPEGDGVLKNSATENTSGSAGLSVVGEKAFFGASVSFFNSLYGIPSEEDVNIDLKQRRLDLKGAIREPQGAFRSVKFRFGLANYEHSELEGEEVGTRFENDAWEGRLEFLHKKAGPFEGAFGFQAQSRDLTVTGEEAFLPPSETRSFAGFILEEAGKGRARLALGARVEHQKVSVIAGDSRSLTGVSGSLGLTLRAEHGLTFGLSVAHSERLPGAEELFSDGPHAATSAFEVGDPDLRKEKSLGLDASVRRTGGRLTLAASVFHNAFDGFIFENFTNEEEDGLRVIRYEQRDARFQGLEVQAGWAFLDSGARHLELEASADAVRASVEPGGAPLPRIAPVRFGGALHYRDLRYDFRAEVRRTQAQDRIAEFETATPGYTFVNAMAAIRLFGGAHTVTDLLVRATNMADTLGRNHVSYLKDLAPLPGRDIRASVRIRF